MALEFDAFDEGSGKLRRFRQYDPDTVIALDNGESVRLDNINAPERGTPAGERANQAAEAFFQQEGLRFRRVGTEPKFGRTAGTFTTPSGERLASQFVREGIANPRDFNRSGATPFALQQGQRQSQFSQTQDRIARENELLGVEPTPRPPIGDFRPHERGFGEEFTAGVSRGVDTLQAGLFGATAALGQALGGTDENIKRQGNAESKRKDSPLNIAERAAVGIRRFGERGFLRNMEQAAQVAPTQSLKAAIDAGPSAVLAWAFGALGEAVPSSALILGTGLAGGVGAGASIALRGGSRVLANKVTQRMLAQGIAPAAAKQAGEAFVKNLPRRAAIMSAFATSGALEGGHIFEETKQAFGDSSPLVAALGGGIAGALDVFSLTRFVDEAFPGADRALTREVLSRVAKAAGIGSLREGATEAMQEVVALVARETQRPDLEDQESLIERALTPEGIERILEAGAAGAVFGGVFGSGAGFVGAMNSRLQDRQGSPETTEVQPEQLLGDESAAPAAGDTLYAASIAGKRLPIRIIEADDDSLRVVDPRSGEEHIIPRARIDSLTPLTEDEIRGLDASRTGVVDNGDGAGGGGAAGNAPAELSDVDERPTPAGAPVPPAGASPGLAVVDSGAVDRAGDLAGRVVVPSPEEVRAGLETTTSAAPDASRETPPARPAPSAAPAQSSPPASVASDRSAPPPAQTPAKTASSKAPTPSTTSAAAAASGGASASASASASAAAPAPPARREATAPAKASAQGSSAVKPQTKAPSQQPAQPSAPREATAPAKAAPTAQGPSAVESQRPASASPVEKGQNNIRVANETTSKLAERLSQTQRRNQHTAKDLAKAEKATQFIGQGAPGSATEDYRALAGGLANTGRYTDKDVVFVSVNGARNGRVAPVGSEGAVGVYKNLDKAIAAGATLVTDDPSNRARGFNLGERQIADYLTKNGYEESAPGVWTPQGDDKVLGALKRGLTGAKRTPRKQRGRKPAPTTADNPIQTLERLLRNPLLGAKARKKLTDKLDKASAAAARGGVARPLANDRRAKTLLDIRRKLENETLPAHVATALEAVAADLERSVTLTRPERPAERAQRNREREDVSLEAETLRRSKVQAQLAQHAEKKAARTETEEEHQRRALHVLSRRYNLAPLLQTALDAFHTRKEKLETWQKELRDRTIGQFEPALEWLVPAVLGKEAGSPILDMQRLGEIVSEMRETSDKSAFTMEDALRRGGSFTETETEDAEDFDESPTAAEVKAEITIGKSVERGGAVVRPFTESEIFTDPLAQLRFDALLKQNEGRMVTLNAFDAAELGAEFTAKLQAHYLRRESDGVQMGPLFLRKVKNGVVAVEVLDTSTLDQGLVRHPRRDGRLTPISDMIWDYAEEARLRVRGRDGAKGIKPGTVAFESNVLEFYRLGEDGKRLLSKNGKPTRTRLQANALATLGVDMHRALHDEDITRLQGLYEALDWLMTSGIRYELAENQDLSTKLIKDIPGDPEKLTVEDFQDRERAKRFGLQKQSEQARERARLEELLAFLKDTGNLEDARKRLTSERALLSKRIAENEALEQTKEARGRISGLKKRLEKTLTRLQLVDRVATGALSKERAIGKINAQIEELGRAPTSAFGLIESSPLSGEIFTSEALIGEGLADARDLSAIEEDNALLLRFLDERDDKSTEPDESTLEVEADTAVRPASRSEFKSKLAPELKPFVEREQRIVKRGYGSPVGRFVERLARSIGLKNMELRLYSNKDLQRLSDAIQDEKLRQRFAEGLVDPAQRSAVVFQDGRAFIYYDESAVTESEALREARAELRQLQAVQRGEATLPEKRVPQVKLHERIRAAEARVAQLEAASIDGAVKFALAHELGHVLYRSLLTNEQRTNSPLWQRLKRAHAGQSRPMEEWFADEVAKWARLDRTPRSLVETFFSKVLRQVRKLIDFALGRAPNGTVLAFLDGLALKEAGVTESSISRALASGSIDTTGYDVSMLTETLRGTTTATYVKDDVAFLRGEVEAYARRTLGGLRQWYRGESALAAMTQGVARTGKFFHEKFIKTADTFLRTQFTPEGEHIEELSLIAEFFERLPGAVRPGTGRNHTVTLGDLTFDLGQETYFEATDREFNNWWLGIGQRTGIEQILADKSDEVLKAALAELQTERPRSAVARQLRAFLDNFFNGYIKRKVLDATARDNFFPVIYEVRKISRNREQWINDLIAHHEEMTREQAEGITNAILRGNGMFDPELMDRALPPGAPSLRERRLTWDAQGAEAGREARRQYQSDNIRDVLHTYLHSTIKRAEWESRFARNIGEGEVLNVQRDFILKHLLLRAQQRGASERQINEARAILEAYLGRRGADIDPHVRSAMSAVLTYENVLLLPMAVLSSLVDGANPVIRSNGDLRSAAKGMWDAIAAYRGKNGNLLDLVKLHGTISANAQTEAVAERINTGYMSAGFQRFNNRFFRMIGLTQWTNFMRTYAAGTAVHFFNDLAARNDVRLLKEFDLDAATVQEWERRGRPVWLRDTPENDATARAMQIAINAFVEQSVFKPTPAQRPGLFSNPHFMLIWNLKQFAWSFAKVILGRLGREIAANPKLWDKVKVALPVLMMFPLAMLGMMIRDWLKYELLPWREGKPEWQGENQDWFDRTMKVAERAGVFGPMQMMLDAQRQSEWGGLFLVSLLGPTATHMETIWRKDADNWALKSVPGLSILPEERRLVQSVFE